METYRNSSTLKHENQVDEILDVLSREQPHIELVSKQQKQNSQYRNRELNRELVSQIKRVHHIFSNREAKASGMPSIIWRMRPELYETLSHAARKKRAYQCSNPSYDGWLWRSRCSALLQLRQAYIRSRYTMDLQYTLHCSDLLPYLLLQVSVCFPQHAITEDR